MSKQTLNITKVNDTVVARLYKTEIVRIDNNKVSLNHGEWKTSCTKKNINKVLGMYAIPVHVFVHQGEWKIADNNGRITEFVNNKQFNYK